MPVELPRSVAQALATARAQGLDRLDVQLLLAHCLQRPRAWLIAHDDALLASADAQAFMQFVERRAAGEPLAYLVGTREFHGLELQVTPDVLVPRPDTETLVDWALELLVGEATPRVIDLGTGSGAIALAIKHVCPGAQVHALDESAAALAVAQANGRRLGLDVTWHRGSWWQALPPESGRFDLVLANPPYVAAGDPHLAALAHEPRSALVPQEAGADGLGAIAAITHGAAAWLEPGAWLLFEHGHQQAPAVRELLEQHGFAATQTRLDLARLQRCTGARWPG